MDKFLTKHLFRIVQSIHTVIKVKLGHLLRKTCHLQHNNGNNEREEEEEEDEEEEEGKEEEEEEEEEGEEEEEDTTRSTHHSNVSLVESIQYFVDLLKSIEIACEQCSNSIMLFQIKHCEQFPGHERVLTILYL